MNLRTYGSWVKNFGFANANFVVKFVARKNRYAQLSDKNKKEIEDILKILEEDYELHLEEGAVADDKILEYTALELIYKEIDTLPELIYFDEICSDGSKRYKPDFAPETYECANYIGPNVLVKKTAASKTEYFHVPRLLISNASPLEEPTAETLEKLRQSLNKPESTPLVSIMIPNKDHIDVLDRCLQSIKKSTYPNYEVVIIENNSTEEETFSYYKSLENERVEAIVTDWNFSHIMNEGMKKCKGDYVILLNNDTEVIAEDWIEQLMYFGTKDEIGAVGAKLLFPDGTLQHAGVTFGIRGVAGHAFYGQPGDEAGYENRVCLPQNQSVVTAACMLVKRNIYDAVGGFDENLKVNYNDVDYCIKVREAGYRIVYNPFAKLYHYESKTRGFDNADEKKLAQQIKESIYFQKKWCRRIWEGDPYYNRNLSLDCDDFSEK